MRPPSALLRPAAAAMVALMAALPRVPPLVTASAGMPSCGPERAASETWSALAEGAASATTAAAESAKLRSARAKAGPPGRVEIQLTAGASLGEV